MHIEARQRSCAPALAVEASTISGFWKQRDWRHLPQLPQHNESLHIFLLHRGLALTGLMELPSVNLKPMFQEHCNSQDCCNSMRFCCLPDCTLPEVSHGFVFVCRHFPGSESFLEARKHADKGGVRPVKDQLFRD